MKPMKKTITLASAIMLAMAGTAYAGDKAAGAAAGGATGAAAGAVVGGPVGAVVGGFAGAVLGSEAAVPERARTYVVEHPVEPVSVNAEITSGARLPQSVSLHRIPENPEFGYVYVDNRPVVAKYETREIVYSPGFVVPEKTVTYVRSNPVPPVSLDIQLEAGTRLPASVDLTPVPDHRTYAYAYVDDRPVLVDANSRTVVWVQ